MKEEIISLSDECVKIALSLGIVKRPKIFKRKFECHVKNICYAWGGVYGKTNSPRISIGLKSVDHLLKKARYSEYKHINDSPTIGGFISSNKKVYVMALIAHEVAHAVDHWNKDKGYGAHKDTWRFIYGQLRRNWVNPLIAMTEAA